MKIIALAACLLVVASTVRGADVNPGELFDPAKIAELLRVTSAPAAAPTSAAAPSTNPKFPRIGDPVDLSFTTMDGQAIDLSKMTGKVVLVDYWATWCVPCRKGLTRLAITYKRYHEHGFEIVGVSLDEDRDALEKLVRERPLPWPQVFDGKGWESPLVAKYGIDSIPASFLIGKDGKVVALNLRDEALDDQVAELLQVTR